MQVPGVLQLLYCGVAAAFSQVARIRDNTNEGQLYPLIIITLEALQTFFNIFGVVKGIGI